MSDSFKEKILPLIKTYGLGISIAILFAVGFRAWILEAFKIPTGVMRPTLEPGDVVFVSKTKEINYGDVVTFEATKDGKTLTYVKRVVGISGDRISLKNGRLTLNGKELPFQPVENAVCGIEGHPKANYSICIEPPVITDQDITTLNEGEFFVIGDARSSGLSRLDHSLIQKSQITGKVKWIWLSIDPLYSTSFMPKLRFDRMFRSIYP
jgi:signal peptidase I